jgi:hypothetical protein
MRIYEQFGTYDSESVFTGADPVSISASAKLSDGTVVETPTPVKDTAFFPNGHYYVELADYLYYGSSDYYVEWTYEATPGDTQVRTVYFRPSDGNTVFAVTPNLPHPRERA